MENKKIDTKKAIDLMKKAERQEILKNRTTLAKAIGKLYGKKHAIEQKNIVR